MIELFKNLWVKEPVRLIAIVTAVIVAVVGQLGDAAPAWATIATAGLVVLAGELGRSQVSPVQDV